MKETNPYVTLLRRLRHDAIGEMHSPAQRAARLAIDKKMSEERAQALVGAQDKARVYPDFFLAALGDSIAQQQEWPVKGMDAIVYALTDRYGWEPEAVRKMERRDQWLALPNQLKSAPMDAQIDEAWQKVYAEPLGVPGEAVWNHRDFDRD